MTTMTANNEMTRTILRDRFAVVRHRLLAVGLGAAAGWGLIAGIVLILVAAWIDLVLDLPGPIRAGADLAAILLAAATGIYILLRARRASSTASMARTLDAAAKANGQIISGIDLMMQPPGASFAGAASPVTLGLAEMAARRAVELVGAVPASVAAPASSLRRPAVFLSATLLFIIAVMIFAPRMLDSQWLRFTDPFGDHPPYSSLRLTVNPNNIKVIYGAAADIRAAVSNGLADRVELVYLPRGQVEQSIPMFPEGEGKWRATLADVTIPGQYFVRAGKTRTQRCDVSVITVPQIEKVTFRVTLPSYTHRPPYDGPLPQAGLAGLPGTTVVVHATSNRPLSGGRITLTTNVPATQPALEQTPGNIELYPTSPGSNEATGVFQIHASGNFQLSVKDSDGQPSTDLFGGTITLLADEKPFVRMIEPRETSFATPDATIKILAAAEDDYGISKLEIYRGLNDSRPRTVDIPIPQNQPTQFSGSMNLALGDYGLSPGDAIKLFARVEDNDPAGAKGSESPIVTIRIVSQADMDQMEMTRNAMEVLQNKYADASRQLEAMQAKADELQKEIDKQDPTKPVSPEEQKKLDQLSKDLAKAADDVQKLASHDLPIDLDSALKQQLTDVSKSMKEASDLAKSASQPGLSYSGASDKLKELRKKLGDRQKEYEEEATAPLAYLDQIYPLIEDQAKYIDLYNRQKDLADRMAAIETMHGQDDPQLKSRMRDLQDEQQHLRDDLRELLEDVNSRVAALPPDKRLDDLGITAANFVKAVRDSDADAQMQETESALDDFAGTRASMGAQAAAATLKKFIAECNSIGEKSQMCLKFQPKLSNSLGNSVAQLLAAASLSTGMGQGGVGGYSAARNSLQNVGLYGTIPVAGHESGGAPGGKADHGRAAQANGSPSGQDNPDSPGGQARLRASGAGDAPVPQQYKKSVSDYFQRVDDELSD